MQNLIEDVKNNKITDKKKLASITKAAKSFCLGL